MVKCSIDIYLKENNSTRYKKYHVAGNGMAIDLITRMLRYCVDSGIFEEYYMFYNKGKR